MKRKRIKDLPGLKRPPEKAPRAGRGRSRMRSFWCRFFVCVGI
jgi:hypothetical protein